MSGDGPPPAVPLAALRAALAAEGAAPRKRLGQHFLRDPVQLERVVEAAAVGPGDTVVEIGPGPGLLTRHLLARGCEVLAFEIDPAMERVAARLIEPAWRSRLTWVEGDAVPRGRRLSEALAARLPEADALVANLPYNVAAPLLVEVLLAADPPRRISVLVQEEMAARFGAEPGTKAYGPISVLAALCARVRVLGRLPAGAFWPAPEVVSRHLALEVRDHRPGPEALARLQDLLGLAFRSRRKTLVNSVAGAARIGAREAAARLGLQEIHADRRAEAFSALELLDLAERWACNAPGERDRP